MATTQHTARDLLALLRQIGFSPAYFLVPIFLAIGAAIFEGAGASLLIPLLNGFIIKDFSFLKETPVLSALLNVLPESITTRDRNLFIFLLCFFVAVIIAKNVLRYAASVSMSFLATRSMHYVRKRLFQAYLQFGKQYFDQGMLGHHSTVIAQFSQYALKPLFTLDKLAQAVFSLCAYSVVMVFISWKLTLFVLPLFFIMHLVVRRSIDNMRMVSKSIAASTMDLNKKTTEILSTIALVQSFNMQEEERRRFTVLSDRRSALEFRLAKLQNMIQPIQELITLVSILILIAAMLYLLVRSGETSAPSFLVYFYLILNASTRFGAFTGFRADFANAAAPLAEVRNILDQKESRLVPEGNRAFLGLKHAIELRDLSFTYTEDVPVLRGVSTLFKRGQQTAIVGPSGSGKTTIISLLLRYYDCPPRTVFIDGTDIRDFSLSSLREHMAVVSQDTLLLNETLRENLTYGSDDVSDERLQDILRQARLSDVVAALPQGLDTLIGDRGVQLSGGEKQRVSLARALLKEADILILDEATSALDSQTERLVQDAIDDAVRGKTAIIIAHRLSTIRHADKIVVLEHGRCVEEGTYDALIKKQGKFHEYWQEQAFRA